MLGELERAEGRCWAADEPPQHICIEPCHQLAVGIDAEPAVCVGPAHGIGSSPHVPGMSAFDHLAYCATQGCGGAVEVCEEMGAVCLAAGGSATCNNQCNSAEQCHAQGYPEHYFCNGGQRCAPLQ